MMNRPASSQRYRDRLVLMLILLVSGPLLFCGILGSRIVENTFSAHMLEEHRNYLDMLSAGLDLAISAHTDVLESLANDPRVQSLNPNNLRTPVTEILSTRDTFQHLLVYDSEFRFIFGRDASRLESDMAGSGLPASRIDTPIQQSMARALGSRPRPTRIEGPKEEGSAGMILALTPIPSFTGDGNPVGSLVGSVVLDSILLDDLLAKIPLREGRFVAILDEAGSILSTRGGRFDANATRFSISPRLAQDLRSGEIVIRSFENDGKTDHVALAHRSNLGGWILLGLDHDLLMTEVRSFQMTFFALFCVAALLAGLLGRWLAEQTSQPVITLANAIAELEEGRHSHRIEEGRGDELGTAARAFNALARRLQRREWIGKNWRND